MTFAGKLMVLMVQELIILRKTSQIQKDKQFMFSPLWTSQNLTLYVWLDEAKIMKQEWDSNIYVFVCLIHRKIMHYQYNKINPDKIYLAN